MKQSNILPFLFLCNRKRTARVRCWSTCGHCCRWYPMTSSRQTTPARKCWSARCSRCGSAGSTWPTSAVCRRLPWWRTASWAAPCHSRPSSWTWCTTNRNRRSPRSYHSGVCHIAAGQLRDTQYTVDHDRTRQDANVDDEHARHIAAGRSLDHGRMEFIKQQYYRAVVSTCYVPGRPSTTNVGLTTLSRAPGGFRDDTVRDVLRRLETDELSRYDCYCHSSPVKRRATWLSLIDDKQFTGELRNHHHDKVVRFLLSWYWIYGWKTHRRRRRRVALSAIYIHTN